MKTILGFSRVVVVIATTLLPCVMRGQGNTAEPLKTTLCEMMKTPEWYSGKMVEIRAVVSYGFETSLLRDESCSAAIWLPGTLVTMISFGGQRPTGPPITLKKDSEYRKMMEFLSKNYTNKPCMHCPLYVVTINATGRFEHVNKQNIKPEERRTSGYGHMNGYESQLVLESVKDVTVKPIDLSIYEKMN